MMGNALMAWGPLLALTVNVAKPYEFAAAKPGVWGVSFFAEGNPSFLFAKDQRVKLVCLPAQRGLEMEWTLAPNFLKTPLQSGRVAPDFANQFVVTPEAGQLAPGFYDLRVKVKLTETEVAEGMTTFGWRVEEMPVHPVKPKDFESFWQKAVKELDGISPKPAIRLEKTLKGAEIGAYNRASAMLPERYDPDGEKVDEVEVYRVQFRSYGNKLIEAWYAKPVGKGPFPAMLVLPGAGNNARPAPVEHARHWLCGAGCAGACRAG